MGAVGAVGSALRLSRLRFACETQALVPDEGVIKPATERGRLVLAIAQERCWNALTPKGVFCEGAARKREREDRNTRRKRERQWQEQLVVLVQSAGGAGCPVSGQSSVPCGASGGIG